MPSLKGSKTEGNLKEPFAGELQANRRYLYFASVVDACTRLAVADWACRAMRRPRSGSVGAGLRA